MDGRKGCFPLEQTTIYFTWATDTGARPVPAWKPGPAGAGFSVCLVYAVYHRGISG